MTIAVSRIAVENYLAHTPGATRDEIARWEREKTIVIIEDEKDANRN